MAKLNKYLLSNFSNIYFSIFLPLYVIASIIMLVKIAAFTSIIQLSLYEMVKLYFFMLPNLLFYTLPITFFISAVMTVSKLSFDYEMTVIFSLGVKPFAIVRFFAKLALMQSFLLFLLFFLVAPHAKNLSENFMIQKKSEAKFNIVASEYGHKFGEWLIFVGESKENGQFGNVILFNQSKDDETLIVSKTANVVNKNNVLKLELNEGKGFTYSKESLSQMKFRKMRINDSSDADKEEYKDTLQYWFGDKELRDAYSLDTPEEAYHYHTYNYRYKRKIQKFSIQSLISLFPVLSLLFILSIGVINARHQKGFTYLFIFLTVIGFFSSVFLITKLPGMYSIAILSALTLGVSYYFYYNKILKRY